MGAVTWGCGESRFCRVSVVEGGVQSELIKISLHEGECQKPEIIRPLLPRQAHCPYNRPRRRQPQRPGPRRSSHPQKLARHPPRP